MKGLYILLIAILFTGADSSAKARPKRTAPVIESRFRSNLFNIIRVSRRPDGFESLKQVELRTGVWNCKMELEGFLPVVELNSFHPADRLQVDAVSVSPAAQRNAKMLLLKGIPGFAMKDSDKDKTVPIDKAMHSRKVVFSKRENHVESTVTVAYNAHQYNSVQITVEAWQYR